MTNNDTIPDFHGSDIEAVAAFYQLDPDKIINFAANVNPLGISQKLKTELARNIDIISQYPERDYRSLRAAIGEYANCNPDHIIPGNGSTELISGVIQSIQPKQAILIAPSYSEYEREVNLCGGQIQYHVLKKENNYELSADALISDCTSDTDLIVLCNPNNPTSNAITIFELDRLLNWCNSHNIIIMIDETYIEFSEHPEAIEAISLVDKHNNLIVLRGVSKFFAAPGLRLGYAVCSNSDLRNTINAHKDPWSINSVAAKAGEIMFQDTDYIQQTKHLIISEKKKMIDALSETKHFKVYPSESNFLLIELIDTELTATECFKHCIKKGLMLRDCSTFQELGDKFLRICMMLPEDNSKIIAALKELV